MHPAKYNNLLLKDSAQFKCVFENIAILRNGRDTRIQVCCGVCGGMCGVGTHMCVHVHGVCVFWGLLSMCNRMYWVWDTEWRGRLKIDPKTKHLKILICHVFTSFLSH